MQQSIHKINILTMITTQQRNLIKNTMHIILNDQEQFVASIKPNFYDSALVYEK